MNEPGKLMSINIDMLISNKSQPRRIFNDESLSELASSIKKYGIINPLLVRPSGEKYEIIAGERRYRAAKLVGLKEVPVIVKNIDDLELLEISLAENLQRENISAIEEAKSYGNIINNSKIPEEKLSEVIVKPQKYISNKLKLMKLPQNIQQALALRKISEKHAKSLLNVEDTERQTELLNRIINEKLSVKELDAIINEKQITEKEIQSAISDIMKSLNMDNEKKEEEKESENMNNESFFPNMNQNIQPGFEPATLNSMNYQTFSQSAINNQQPIPQMDLGIPQQQETPIPQMNPLPNFDNQISPQVEVPTQSVVDMPLFNNASVVSPTTPNLELQQADPVVTPQINQTESTPIPDFNFEPSHVEIPSSPVVDMPLFNNEATMIPQQENQPQSEPVYEVPVATSPMSDVAESSQKLIQVQELLNNNGIQYKSYSNESGHCIIIEL